MVCIWDQMDWTPSLYNPLVPTITPGNHFLGPFTWNPAQTWPYSTVQIQIHLRLRLQSRKLRRRCYHHDHTATIWARQLVNIIRRCEHCHWQRQFRWSHFWPNPTHDSWFYCNQWLLSIWLDSISILDFIRLNCFFYSIQLKFNNFPRF